MVGVIDDLNSGQYGWKKSVGVAGDEVGEGIAGGFFQGF